MHGDEEEIGVFTTSDFQTSSRNSSSTGKDEKDNSPSSFVNESLHEGEDQYIDESVALKKDLKKRHLIMIAIGGAVGPGLLIGSNSAIYNGGVGSTFIAYLFVGMLVYGVMTALGEMACWIILPANLSGYPTRYVDPALGFATGYCYLIDYLISSPNQLTSASLIMQYWVSRDTLNPGVWIAIYMVVILAINSLGVKAFGEVEFYVSSLKIITIIGLIILMIVLFFGGAPNDHSVIAFRYWKNPGAFKAYDGIDDEQVGKFASFVSVLVTAVFSYVGLELLVVTLSEVNGNVRKVIPKAINMTFIRILLFYCVSLFFVGSLIAYNDPRLVEAVTSSRKTAASSPFVIAIENAGIHGLPHVVNACILIFALSSANSDFYVSVRTLYGLAINGQAPRIFAKTNRFGIPYYSYMMSALFCLLGFMNVSSDSRKVFKYFVNVVSVFGLLIWISILYSHICFMRAMKAQGISRDQLPYRAPFQPYFTYITLFFVIIVTLVNNFGVFVNGFDYKDFITGYIGIPVYLILIFGYKIIIRSKRIKSSEADLFSYKEVIDQQCEQFEIEKAAHKEMYGTSRSQRIYERYFEWLF